MPDRDTRYGAKRPLRFFKKRLEYQREAPLLTSFPRRLSMWRGGLREASYRIYDVGADGAAYLPDTARLETYFINGTVARGVLKDKLLFSQTLGPLLPVPETVGFIERGIFYRVAEPGAPNSGLLDALAAHGSLVLKPSDGTRGQGVLRLEGAPLRLSGEPVTEEAVREHVCGLDNILVTETVQQAAYAQAIFPGSTNTVRVMTFVDPDMGEPFIARAVHRFGARGTEPTDNWSRGGLCALIDLQSGTLSRGVKHAKRTAGRLEWQPQHPDTGAAIEGVVIPHWDALCRALLEAVRALPLLVYVGWDVVVTDTGFCVLEGNANPDLDLLQVHGGLLNDPRVRRFYEHHKVV